MKRHDDYKPGETRQKYVERRKKENNPSVGIPFWHSISVWNGPRLVQGTLAKPKTKEYRRFLTKPQYSGHIKNIDRIFEEVDN